MSSFRTPTIPDTVTAPPDSSVSGYLAQLNTVLEGAGLSQVIHDALSGVSGIPGNLVRLRWQPEPPNIPDFGTNWLSFAAVRVEPDTYSAIIHQSPNGGTDLVYKNSLVDFRIHAYGPAASETINRIIAGFQVSQNREILFKNGVGIVDFSDPRTAAEFIKMRYTYRVDCDMTIRVEESRIFAIRNLLAAQGTITPDGISEEGLFVDSNFVAPSDVLVFVDGQEIV